MGLFDSLPPPSKAPAESGKRAAEDASVDGDAGSSKRSRSSRSEGELASASSEASLGAAVRRTRLEAASSEDIGSRITMEDVAVINLEAGDVETGGCRLSFFGVFDGHGGRSVAEFIAAHLNAACLAAGLQQEAQRIAAAAAAAGSGDEQQVQPSVKACKAAIAEGFRQLDRCVLEQCADKGWADGSTAVAAWVLADTVVVANVGDARCVLARRPAPTPGATPAAAAAGAAGVGATEALRHQAGQEQPAAAVGTQQQGAQQQQQRGQPQQAKQQPLKAVTLTREHKAIFPQERQRIERAGSFVSGDGRLAGRIEVSRAFGDRQFKKQGMSAVPDVQAFAISRRDAFMLLACDGFWGVFSPQDAVDFAQRELAEKCNSVKQTCNRLIHEAIRERRCKDNCTVMLVQLLHDDS